MITQTFNLNMIPESAPVIIKCDQYDIGTGRLVATLYNGSVTYTPSAGATAMIQGTKPDGLGFAYEATISGSTVTCDLTEQMTAVAGRTRVNLVITESENRTGTFVFWLDVQATGLADDVDISETEIPAYISAAQTAAANAAASADDAHDSEVNAAASASNAYSSEQNASSSATNAYNSEVNAASSADSAAASLASSTQVDFEIIGNDLYLTKTIAGVEQPSEDLGRVVGAGSTVDSALSSTSENAVQNKVIYDALGLKADASDLTAKQPKTLDTPLTIDGTEQTTVEGALGALVNMLIPQIVTFADGTDEQLKAMLKAHYLGFINIHDYWSVGDERTVSLSAMSATGVGESHVAQSVTMVLMSAGGKTLVNNKTCAFIVGQKNLLANGTTLESGYMYSTSSGTAGWKDSARRTWCNDVYYNAIPSGFRALLKQFINQSGLGGGSTSGTEDSIDWAALPAQIEVKGSSSVSVDGEGTQFEYYTNASHYIKYAGESGGAAGDWWTRSPIKSTTYPYNFCTIGASGGIGSYNANSNFGIAPFFCI